MAEMTRQMIEEMRRRNAACAQDIRRAKRAGLHAYRVKCAVCELPFCANDLYVNVCAECSEVTPY